jgi:hypothetical protein
LALALPVDSGLALTRWPALFYFRSEDKAEGTLFAPAIANLKRARTLALDGDLAVQRAQFDLSNMTARCFCAR